MRLASVCAAALVLTLTTFITAAAAGPATPGLAVEQTQAAQEGTAAKTPPVNLNTASQKELETLPGVGPAMAVRIIEYRTKEGGFKKAEDLMNVRGIGEKVFLKLKPLVTVTPAKGTAW